MNADQVEIMNQMKAIEYQQNKVYENLMEVCFDLLKMRTD